MIMPATPRGTAILGSRLRYNRVCQQADHKDDTEINHNSIDQVASEMFLINLSGEIPQVSEIRLRRTDTTLDLSQKAEKV